MIKRIVFDYGRTLFDRDTNQFFPEIEHVLKYCSKKYDLSIVSYSKPDDIKGRYSELEKMGLLNYFKGIWFVDRPELKHDALDSVLKQFHLQPAQVAVVDDYVIRGVAWANNKGATSVWFQNGKFENVHPNKESGEPNYIIRSFGELTKIF